MPRINNEDAGGKNVTAFLDMVAYAEIGHIILNDPKSDNGYKVLVGSTPNNIITFDSYADHPRILVPLPRLGIKSTAAGRYQLLSRYWNVYKRQLGLKDFSPISQDLVAIRQIKEQRALEDIKDGQFEEAVRKVRNIWASMPSAGYGQHEHKMEALAKVFTLHGGEIA